MKKRILALLLAAATALTLCACAPTGEDAEDGRLQVVCSLFPYYDFVREIGGVYVSPHLLVAAGREAHSFEPTPMDVIRVSTAAKASSGWTKFCPPPERISPPCCG